MEAIVQTILTKMGKARKPELTDLSALFTAILTVCGKVNFMNLSRSSDLAIVMRRLTAVNLKKG